MGLRRHPLLGAIILLILLALVSALSLSRGARPVPVGEVADILRGVPVSDSFATAVVLERVPRLVFCLLAGGALGVSGLLMQAVTRNPIADPSILGVNSGASLAVVWVSHFWASPQRHSIRSLRYWELPLRLFLCLVWVLWEGRLHSSWPSRARRSLWPLAPL